MKIITQFKINTMKLFKQIKDLYRIDPMVVINGKVYYKSKFQILLERITQFGLTFGLIFFISIAIRLIF